MERLQKVLAQANIASRRKAETIILEGRVKVNGVVVKELGTKVNKDDLIEVDGKAIEKAAPVYFLLNKPTGYVSTTSDEKGRKTVLDLIDQEHKNIRLYPIGRLDFDTAGLLLLTNDGEFTNILTHPEHEVEKEYLLRVQGIVIKDKIRQMRKGVIIDDDYLAIPKHVHILELDKQYKTTQLTIVLTEGRNKQVRKMFDAIGHPVTRLTRIRYGELTLDGVERGLYRPLKIHEVRKLYGYKSLKK
jgi:23S rRNA pseudouridine2605 synthase